MMKHSQQKYNRAQDHKDVHMNKRKLLLALIFILVAIFFLYQPLKNFAVNKMVRFGTAEWKVLEQVRQEEAVIIREETVITASTDGTFETVAAEGDKVAVGQIIGYIKTRGAAADKDSLQIPVKAPKAGVLSYQTDGLEEVLKPDLLNHLHIDKISSLLSQQQEETVHFPQTAQGKSLCKIVDNLINPYLYIATSSSDTVHSIKKGDTIKVRFANGMMSQALVREVKESDHQSVILVRISNGPDLDIKTRHLPVELITDFYEGVTILKDALVQVNDETGVFVFRHRLCRWKKVEVLGTIGDEVVVSGLDIGEEYIINPSLIREGQRLY
ncbi:MAG: HlyD family efflux transporter periplasmic adaptor subunit [Dehalobacterium sp.]|jgi:putative membrane fusion protein